MPKHLTGPSPSQKIKYAAGPARIARNKIRTMQNHMKRQPNDNQTKQVLEGK